MSRLFPSSHSIGRISPLLCVLALLIGTGRAQAQEPETLIPITGDTVPGMESYDHLIAALMQKYDMPGASVAVMQNDRLVFAHGYGYADIDGKQPVQPTSLFRIASVSKTLTSAAIMLLVQKDALHLEDRVFDILNEYQPLPGATEDPRLRSITIGELLQHSGGWDRDTTSDPTTDYAVIAQATHTRGPIDQTAIIRYVMGQPLQFDPGTKFAYSNFGFLLLGRVIEKVCGQSYEQFVKENILDPLGARDMMIGHTFLRDRTKGEVRYYDYPGAPLVSSAFNYVDRVPKPYGGVIIELRDSHGGWLASPSDILRFVAAIDGLPARPDFLTPQSLKMIATPPTYAQGKSGYYGLGWFIRTQGQGANWWHGGALPGTATLVVKASNGLAWAAFFNTRPKDKNFDSELDQVMWQAAKSVTQWPTTDLFDVAPEQP